MVINQGDVFWVNRGIPFGSEPGYTRPYLVIQNDDFNSSRINTVVACSLTTNVRRASSPGNVLLEKGEADLPEQSVVNVTQIITFDKKRFTKKIGSLSRGRMAQVLAGIELLLKPADIKG